MKLKTVAQIILLGWGLSGLVACSSVHKDSTDDAAVEEANSNAAGAAPEASGAGDSSSFNSEDGNSGGSQNLLSKRTYYFPFDRSDVRDEDKAAIAANATNLVAHSKAKVLLEGHTDPRGSREYNVALGERRAKAVEALLKAKGVGPDRIRVVSYGAERVAVPGHSESDYQQDRRVVLVYLQQ